MRRQLKTPFILLTRYDSKTLHYLWVAEIDSLFINIPLDETIDICINELFEYTDRVEGFTKSDLKQLLCLATKEPYFKFIDLLYKQTDGVAMVSPLGTSLTNAFL